MIMKYDFCLFELWVSRIFFFIGKVMGLEPMTSLSNVDRKNLRKNTIKYQEVQDLWPRFDVGLSWHIS